MNYSKKIIRAVLWLFGILLLACVLKMPSYFTREAANTLAYCLNTLTCAMLPFLVVCAFLCESGFCRPLGQTLGRPFSVIFGVSCDAASVILMSLCSGPPSGALCAASLYTEGRLTRREAERTAALSSALAPSYLIAGVGGAVCSDMRFGLMLYAAQTAAMLVFGLMLRLLGGRVGSDGVNEKEEYRPLSASLVSSVASAGRTLVGVCASVVFFSLCSLLFELFFSDLGLYLRPLIELTSGLIPSLGRPYIAFLCGFTGLAMLLNSLSALESAGLSPKLLILGRLFGAVVCTFVTICSN